MELEERIKKDLQQILSEKRYQHCLNTALEAKKLASNYKISEDMAYLCGLVHDIAREFTEEQNEKLIVRYQLPESLLNKENKKFLHAILGAKIVREWYNFTSEMYHAVKYHPTGRPNMTTLEKIVYLADKIEVSKNYPNIEEERFLAYQDLDQAIQFCLETKISKLKAQGKEIHPWTMETLENFQKCKESVSCFKEEYSCC